MKPKMVTNDQAGYQDTKKVQVVVSSFKAIIL